MKYLQVVLCCLLLAACDGGPWNSPYPPKDAKANILYSAFVQQPKHLDPAIAYSSDEYQFIAQVVEPVLQYHYLRRPYTLTPLTAVKMPEVRYIDANEQAVEADDPKLAYTDYIIELKPGIYYGKHPAFVQSNGRYVYHHLTAMDLQGINDIEDFPLMATRELHAADYVYQIKRLAQPKIHSPILSVLEKLILGLENTSDILLKLEHDQPDTWHDLRQVPLSGVEVIDDYHYRIRIHGKDPQFMYWLAMPFLAPIPWEADKFYAQLALQEKNIVLDWYPIGTGPYRLTKNDPNRAMILEKNSLYHAEYFPDPVSSNPDAKVLSDYAGKRIPFLDKAIYSLEKESIPRWGKFLQGYYDFSGITSDNFDQAITSVSASHNRLTDTLKKQGLSLNTSVSATTIYWGFNMLDPVVGGDSERAKKLRQAISIAVDIEEYISIFMNGRGIAAQSPLPPGIFGYQAGANPQIYRMVAGKPKRRSIAEAKKLLVEAGYPSGRDIKTGKPLVIHYDVIASGGPDDKARLTWLRKQFDKLDISLAIRATQYNRFREKVKNGNAQLFSWGWHADYPDPENFLFLLYGPNGKVKHGGENATNYHNSTYDRLFDQMKNMSDSAARKEIITRMIQLLQSDAPWLFGFHPKRYLLSHQWNSPIYVNEMANNTLKYIQIDPNLRQQLREQWNQPITWPLWLCIVLGICILIPFIASYWYRQHKSDRRIKEIK